MSKTEDVKKAVANVKLTAQTGEVTQAETAAEVAKHRIQAGYLVAMNQPRNVDSARARILKTCERPRFAERVEYYKPIGKSGVSGPTIRFAEMALREWGNIISDIQVVHEDDAVRRSKVYITDLETNTTFTKEITIKKLVERKYAKDREVIGSRLNSKGDKVFIVIATDDEIHNKEAAMLSKALRNEGLRLIPSDIVDEAIDIARETLKKQDAEDPDSAKKRILDAFSKLDIMPEEIEEYIGHSIKRLSSAELGELRGIWRAIDEGSAKWEDYLDKKKPKSLEPEDAESEPVEEKKKRGRPRKEPNVEEETPEETKARRDKIKDELGIPKIE